MANELDSLIKKINKRFSDSRTELAEIVLEESTGRWIVSGRVLDSKTRSAVLAGLSTALPGAEVMDTLQELRKPHPQWMNVAVNLTGLYARPSWLAEMLSQNIYGAVVEILEDRGEWVFVRQLDGYLGWMFKDYLSLVEPGISSHRVGVPMMLLRTEPDEAAPVAFRLPEGAEVQVSASSGSWMKIEPHPDGLPCGLPGGWAKSRELMAVQTLPGTPDEKRQVILATALGLVGVPYLWGGTTAAGIDCSGLAQLSYRMAGLTLPRDADMQKEAGQPLESPNEPGDLLFFCSEEDRSRISHVAISLGGWKVIHSSRRRNGVAVDDVQAVPHLKETYLSACTYFNPES